MSAAQPTLDRPLGDLDFIALDLETTGLEPASSRIVEFGAIRFRLEGETLGSFEQLVDPQCRIPRVAVEVHGITDVMVRGSPTVGDVLPRFFDFLGDPATILLAHNASFDLGFLTAAATKSGLHFPNHAVLDTLDLARVFLRGLYRRRLIDVASYLGVAKREDHRALSDARLVMDSFRAMIARRPELRCAGDLFQRSAPIGFEASATSSAKSAVDYRQLALAIENQQVVEIVYLGGTQGPAPRRITPRALLQSGGRALLTALCHADRVEKTYRMDRIVQWRFDVEAK
jgi:DNA polymerase III epsilon subunit family exonuclease